MAAIYTHSQQYLDYAISGLFQERYLRHRDIKVETNDPNHLL